MAIPTTIQEPSMKTQPFVREIKPLADARGYFSPIWDEAACDHLQEPFFSMRGLNLSTSKKNVVRGLHTQLIKPQAKIITVLSGEINDVVISYGRSSHFGIPQTFRLRADGINQIFVPKNCLHGFEVLSPSATIVYAVDEFWDADDELAVDPSDSALTNLWHARCENLVISDKDKRGLAFNDFLQKMRGLFF